MTTADDDMKDRFPVKRTYLDTIVEEELRKRTAWLGDGPIEPDPAALRIAERAFLHGVDRARQCGPGALERWMVQPAPAEEKKCGKHTFSGDVFAVCSCDRRKGERRMGGEVKNKGFYVLVYNKTPYGAEMKVAPERRTLIPGFDSWASVERRKRGSSPSMDKP